MITTAMSAKQSRPVIRKMPNLIVTGDGPAHHDAILSPRSPLERDPRSPKGWKNRESDGIGLGIAAALEKLGGEIPAKCVVGSSNFNVSSPPILIASPRTTSRYRECLEGFEVGCTSRVCEDLRWREYGFFCASTPRSTKEIPVFPMADFLSFCSLCRKKLHGKDIYMYRGEKAFCSMECRYRQIVSDECQEKCGSEASKPSDISSSPYSGGRLFYTGIVAA